MLVREATSLKLPCSVQFHIYILFIIEREHTCVESGQTSIVIEVEPQLKRVETIDWLRCEFLIDVVKLVISREEAKIGPIHVTDYIRQEIL